MSTQTLVVSGSEAAAACGVDPFRSPVQLWTEKIGLAVEREESESMKWGTLLQPVIAEQVERRGYAVLPAPADAVTSDAYPWLSGHPDGYSARNYMLEDERGVLEIKTTSPYRQHEWADEQVPAHVYVQATVYMMLTGLRWALAACLIGGQALVLREFEYDDETAQIIANKTREFLGYVETQTPPPPSKPGDAALVYPHATGEVVQITTETYALCKRREELRRQAQELERQQGLVDEDIRLALGEASVGVFEGRRVVSWAEVTRKGYSVEPKTYRSFRVNL